MLLRVKHARVRSLSVDYLELSWEVEETSEDVLDYTFQVLRSEAAAGPWEPVSPELEDTYFFVDNRIKSFDRYRQYFYLLRLRHKPSGEVEDFGPVHHEPEPDLIALELRSHFNLLLQEFVGRRCWVLPARSFGQRCPSCWSTSLKKRLRSGCRTCFAPGTLVRAEGGWVPIESVKVGDRVLSSDGTFRVVTETLQREYVGGLLRLRPSTATNEILVTPEHPFLTVRGSHRRTGGCGPSCDTFISRRDGNARKLSVVKTRTGRWWARIRRGGKQVSLATFATREAAVAAIQRYNEENLLPGHTFEWDAAENISPGDWLVSSWPKNEHDVETVSVPEAFRQKTKRAMARLVSYDFVVDQDFLWVLGLYLAEGSAGKRRIVFSLHEDETLYQERLVAFFQRYGYRPRVLRRRGSRGIIVSVSSTTLAAWFPSWVGTACHSKRVPEELMYLPAHKSWALINGIYDGDGHKKYREITQTSEVLALQLTELLHRLGEQPLVRRQISRIPTPKGNQRRVAYVVSWARDTLGHENRKGRWKLKGRQMSQVKSVGLVPYHGPVYNLEVEGDHTYVVQGVVVHNCYDTSFVRGYHTPVEAWVQFDPNPKHTQHTNLGELQQSNTTARMGYFPPLKPRDIIIEPENRRWRVTAVSETQRLRAPVHQEVQLHEIPKSDSEYLIRLDLGSGEIETPEGKKVVAHTLHSLFLAGRRNFSNPHTLERFEQEVFPDIVNLYPGSKP